MSTISISNFAELVGISTRTASDLLKRKVIERTAGGLPHPEALRKYVAHLRETAAGRGGNAATEVAAERAALLKTQRQRAEFQLAQELGKWVELSDVERNWASALRTLRSGVMAIPARVAARVPGLSREFLYEMDQEVREALTELARDGYPDPYADDAPQGSPENSGHPSQGTP